MNVLDPLRHVPHRDAVHACRSSAAVARDAREGHPQVAGVGDQPPQLAEDVVDVLLTSRVQLSLLDPEPVPIGSGRHIHGFPRRLRRPYPSLPPFAMCAAFPRSDYYGGSAPRPRRRRTCRLAGLRVPGARIEVPMFAGGTLGAVGGRLYPWQRGPRAESGHGGGVPMSGTPSHAEIATGRWLHLSRARVLAPYRGFHHRLQLRDTPPASPWHLR